MQTRVDERACVGAHRVSCLLALTAISSASGGVVVTGGCTDPYNKTGFTSAVQVFDMDPLPNLPITINRHTLSAVGSVLYSCGGYNSSTSATGSADCFVLNTKSSSHRWYKNVTLPEPMYGHTAVTIGSHIWFIYKTSLYDFDTTTNSFKTYKVPFNATNACAVSDGSKYSYIIGVGSDNKDIWRNANESDPSTWIKLQEFSNNKESSGCIMIRDLLYATGGVYSAQHNEIYDTATNETRLGTVLPVDRYGHGMVELEGEPAVAGGYSGEYNLVLKDVDAYISEKQVWIQTAYELHQPVMYFGIVKVQE